MDIAASRELTRLLLVDGNVSSNAPDGRTASAAASIATALDTTAAAPTNSVVSVELVTRLAQRLSASQDRIAKLVRIEKAIADFHGEVAAVGGHLDRQAPPDEKGGGNAAAPTAPSVMDGDTLALIHSLRTFMRMQLAFRDDYEATLKSSLRAVSTAKFKEESSANDRAAALTLERDALLRDKKALLDQMDETEAVKALVAAQSMEALEQSRAATEHLLRQLADVRTELKKAQDTCRWQAAQLAEKEEETAGLTQRIESLQRNTQGGGDLSTKAVSKGGADGATSGHRNQDADTRQANLKIAHLEAENQANRDQLKDLKTKLQGYTSSAHALAFSQAQKDAARFKERAKDVEGKLAAAEADLMKTRGRLAEKGTRLQVLQAEYDKIFTALKRESDKQHVAPAVPETVSADEASRIANDNPYVTGYYRSKLEHQAAEILGLRKQIKTMLTQQHQTFFDQSLQKKEHLRLLTRYAELKRLDDKEGGASSNQHLHHASSVPSLPTHTPDVDRHEIKQLVRRNQFLERLFRHHSGDDDVQSSTDPSHPILTTPPQPSVSHQPHPSLHPTTTVTMVTATIPVTGTPASSATTPALQQLPKKTKRPASAAAAKPKHVGDPKRSFVVGALLTRDI